MIKFTTIIIINLFIFVSCNNGKVSSQNTIQDSSLKQVSLNLAGDTNFVILQYSTLYFIIRYYKNKPQSILIQNNNLKESFSSHYMKENKGVFLNMNSDGFINSIGYKYLRNNGGADIAIDSSGNVENFTNWQHYSNNGKVYDVRQSDKGLIKVYTFKDGDKVDSLMYLNK